MALALGLLELDAHLQESLVGLGGQLGGSLALLTRWSVVVEH